MLKNYVLITIRSMMKNKLYIFINIFGMAIAIACCIIGYYDYDFNANFDAHHVNRNNIYRVNSLREYQGATTEYGYVPEPLGEIVRETVPDVSKAIRWTARSVNFKINDELFRTGLAYVDPEFFDVFSFSLYSGKAEGLRDKSKIFISENAAKKYFGNENPLGKLITQILPNEEKKDYEVAGVYALQPANSSFNEDAFTNYENYWDIETETQKGTNWKTRNTLFLYLNDPTRISAIESQLKPFTANNNRVKEDFIINSFRLDPFVGMATRDERIDRPGSFTRGAAPTAAVVGTGVMGILVLLIACFNLTNTTIAISSRRLKEIGIRKVMGSLRKQLIVQFLGETLLVCFCALLLGVLLAEVFLIPAFNVMWPYMKLSTSYVGNPTFLIFMVGTLLFVVLLAGSYPSLYISKFEPASILKGTLKFGGTNYFTRSLLTLQFAISLIAIVSSIGFVQNAEYQRAFDMGFDKQGVISVYVNNQSDYETYRNSLAGNSDIVKIAGTNHHLYASAYNDPIKHKSKEIEVDILDVGEEYVDAMGLTLLQGRNFKKDSETDRRESVIITEKAARDLGMVDPLGKEIIWMDTAKFYVIGVIKDVYTNGLWHELDPMMLRYTTEDQYRRVIVSTTSNKLIEVNRYMEGKWNELFPNRMYTGRYMNEVLAEAITTNNNILKMFVFLGIVVMMLSATGLFTMVSLNILKKMKEIGVRKVLGASVTNIARIINTEFVIILCIASVVGCYLGGFLTDSLMGSIWDYYQSANAFTYIFAVSVLFIISGLAIGFKVFNTAKMNPVKTLRDE